MATRKSAAPKSSKPAGTAKGRAVTTTPKQGAKAQKPLAPKVQRFILEYLIDFNGSAAYQRAGYKATGNSAEVNARRLLRNAQVSAEIARAQAKTAKKLEISREEALSQAWNIVLADARELVEFVVTCCRCCYGKGGKHQWVDEEEYQKACARAIEEHERAISKRRANAPEPVLRIPSDAGGFGFDPRLTPNADCASCMGRGHGEAVFKDTRNLSAPAAAIYAGVKQTKEGLEIKMHSKLDALEKVFKHLGLYERDNDQKKAVLSEQLAEFLGGIHASAAGRIGYSPARKA